MVLISLWFAVQIDASVKQAMLQSLASLDAFQVAFTQTTYSDFFDETEAEGSFFVSRPGKMRMVYTEGEQILRIWDGTTAYERDTLAAEESRVPQEEFIDEPVVQLLLYGSDLDRLFLIDRIRKDNGDVYRLRPRNDESFHVEVRFDSRWIPLELEVIGEDGEGTRFVFRDFKRSKDFPPNTFVIPEARP